MPDEVEQAIIDKKLKFYVIDAAKIARENGMGTRTNTVLQTAFFKLSGITLKKADGTVLDPIQVLKDYAEKAYSKKGQEVVEMNWKCIEAASARPRPASSRCLRRFLRTLPSSSRTSPRR